MKRSSLQPLKLVVVGGLFVLLSAMTFASGRGRAEDHPIHATVHGSPAAETIKARSLQGGLFNQTKEQSSAKSAGCLTCHTDTEDMHSGILHLGCTDCHGGKAEIRKPEGADKGSPDYDAAKNKAHVPPRYPENWKSSANPVRSSTRILKESPEFVRFINPGDLRVAELTCGNTDCHPREVKDVRKSMMAVGGLLWGTALYNNGGFLFKNTQWGESYSADGTPMRVQTVPTPTAEETKLKGVLPFVDPLARWEITQPGNILRVFERGGEQKGLPSDIGSPNVLERPGLPDDKLSDRGFGTKLRTDPVWIGLQKTRLLDPMLWFLGTNDHPGDYRSSGCTGCHVVYANDRDPLHSGPYARFGNMGTTATADPTIPRDEPGHPIVHRFTRAVPSSSCMVCHMHPGTNMVTTYFGYTWWDNETDGEEMYRGARHDLSPEEIEQIKESNPEGSAIRGRWGQDPRFLADVWKDVNPKLKHTQFADFHGHGWIFRAVYKQDRKGNLLDDGGAVVSHVTNDLLRRATEPHTDEEWKNGRPGVPVQLSDIHMEKGMHCVDCHFKQDNHGTGKLMGEPRAAIEIGCTDCHGTIEQRADPTVKGSMTSGPAGPNSMVRYQDTPFGKDRFYKRNGKLFQRSALDPGKEWEVVQVLDTITPGGDHYNEQSRLAKTIQTDGQTWGVVPKDQSALAHPDKDMTCFACHTSWTTSCFGCHLPMVANQQRAMLHNEGEQELRNWTSYNFQTLRDDVYMLGRDGTVTGHRVAPIRSSCAVLVSSQNANRDWLYEQQQTLSTEGLSGQAFSSYVPHTVRGKETRQCTDCHLSKQNDNNAWMAAVLLQGTNFVNFIGRFVYVATGKEGLEAVAVTEQSEPQAVIGSDLHRLAYPEEYAKHEARGSELELAREHHGNPRVLGLQMRGEYLYAACGEGGLRIYDIANVGNKNFSEKISTAPVSPLGQKFFVRTRYATAVASPSTLALDPTRNRRPENEEPSIHLMYAFLYVTDKYEGLIVAGNPLDDKKNKPGVATLLDGDSTNNFIQRAVTFNPEGKLNGASNIIIAGTYAYITCDRGLTIVSIDDPLHPRIVAEIGSPAIKSPRAVAVQFRYAFVTDEEGLKVVDVTIPEQARIVDGALVRLNDARGVYVARTYAYVANGRDGIAIIDVERPEHPTLDQNFNANEKIADAHDIKLGMTNNSLFAYVADGSHGLKVIQLLSPETTPGIYGFSPRPAPKLIATYHTHGEALAISKGLDRDRAVDESGNQLSVFGRRGARPFNLEEMRRMFLRDGKVWTVTNTPPGPPAGVGRMSSSSPGSTRAALFFILSFLFFPLVFVLRLRTRGSASFLVPRKASQKRV